MDKETVKKPRHSKGRQVGVKKNSERTNRKQEARGRFMLALTQDISLSDRRDRRCARLAVVIENKTLVLFRAALHWVTAGMCVHIEGGLCIRFDLV